jgi:hypothetical protein
MKYIRFDFAGFVIFGKNQKHSDVAALYPNDTPLSAGFVMVDPCVEDGKVCVYGESQSLGISSNKKDEALMRAQFQL